MKPIFGNPSDHIAFPDQAATRRRISRMPNLQERTLSALSRYFPKTIATLDWLQPDKLNSWGGPMNGQLGRQCLIRHLCKSVEIAAVVETGTYRGTTTEFLWQLTGVPVYSVESQRRFYEYAKRRFTGNAQVHLSLSDSQLFLQQLAKDRTLSLKSVLFYLDAHWGSTLPLHQELLIILEHWEDAIIIIDDFEVPADPGYGFDDYGEGKSLTWNCLPAGALERMAAFSPSLPSCDETGARRGCAIFAKQSRASSFLANLPLVRVD